MHTLTDIETLVHAGRWERRARYMGCRIQITMQWSDELSSNVVRTIVRVPQRHDVALGPFQDLGSTAQALDAGLSAGVDWVNHQLVPAA